MVWMQYKSHIDKIIMVILIYPQSYVLHNGTRRRTNTHGGHALRFAYYENLVLWGRSGLFIIHVMPAVVLLLSPQWENYIEADLWMELFFANHNQPPPPPQCSYGAIPWKSYKYDCNSPGEAIVNYVRWLVWMSSHGLTLSIFPVYADPSE